MSTPLRGTIRPSCRTIRSSGSKPSAARASGLLIGQNSVGSKPQGMIVDLRGVGVVEADQVLLVLRALGDDAVGLRDDAVLDGEPLVGEAVRVLLMQAAHPAERVEGDDEGRARRPLDLRRHQAGHPEVRVDQVVRHRAAACRSGACAAVNSLHVRQQLFLAHDTPAGRRARG